MCHLVYSRRLTVGCLNAGIESRQSHVCPICFLNEHLCTVWNPRCCPELYVKQSAMGKWNRGRGGSVKPMASHLHETPAEGHSFDMWRRADPKSLLPISELKATNYRSCPKLSIPAMDSDVCYTLIPVLKSWSRLKRSLIVLFSS